MRYPNWLFVINCVVVIILLATSTFYPEEILPAHVIFFIANLAGFWYKITRGEK